MKYNRIRSKITEIEALRVYPLPVRAIAALSAVRYQDTHVIIGLNSRIYSSEVKTWQLWQTTKRMNGTMACLQKLGMLSADVLRKHNEAAEAERIASEKRSAADAILDNIEAIGLVLTSAQRAKLKKLSATGVSNE